MSQPQEPVYTALEGQLLTGFAAMQAQVAAFQEQSRIQNQAVVDRLDKLNSKIADHEKRIGEIQIEQARRENACPVVDKLAVIVGRIADNVKEVEQDIEEQKGEKRSSAQWLKYAWPLICGFLGVLVTLIALHGRELTSGGPKLVP